MFEVSAQHTFNATHAIVIDGQREPVHGHDWIVEATIAGPTLDAQGLLCDFHAVETALDRITAPWHHGDLNRSDAFRQRNIEPTAENVALVVAEELIRALENDLAPGARVARVRVTEAPNCTAAHVPPPALARTP